MTQNEVVPVFEKMLSRQQKEQRLGQHACVIWFTGLPCSGKTTLALSLERELFSRGFFCQILDGDNVRCGINNNLGFSNTDRLENIRRIAEVSKLYVNSGIITINAFVSPTREIRELAKGIIGNEDFLEIYLNPSLAVCEERDVKGMYRKARAGLIHDFTGVNAPFEAPENPFMQIDTSGENIEFSTNKLMSKIFPIIMPDKSMER